MKPLDLTTIILTYNEELHIRRCLENVSPISKRVLVVDCFSKDATCEICKAFPNVEVVQHTWPGDQATQYNWAIDTIPIDTEWILRIDADEYLLPELVDELEEKEFSKIKVFDVIRRAKVSRMSFYRYYENLYDALCDYLNIIVNGYMIEGGEVDDPGVFMRLDHIEFSLNYFDRYARYFLTLNSHGLYAILIDAVNEYMMKNILPQKKLHMYELYAYAGGLLNSFLKWEENGKKESARNVAEMIYRLYKQEA